MKLEKNKELETLYKMLGDYNYRNLSGIETDKDHLNDGSTFLMTSPKSPDNNPKRKVILENKNHKGKTVKRTKTFIKNVFRLKVLFFTIEDYTSTNDRLYTLASKLIIPVSIITLFLLYAIFKG